MLRRAALFSFAILLLGIAPVRSGYGLGTETRLKSPSGKIEIIFRPIDSEHAKAVAEVKGVHGKAHTAYEIEFWQVGSSTTINAFNYVDGDPRPSPQELLKMMLWSPDEHFVAMPAMIKTLQGNHHLQDVISFTGGEHISEFDAEHLRWIDDHRLVGDVNTEPVPGAVIVFDANTREVRVTLAPMTGIGFKILFSSGKLLTLEEFTNAMGADKTTWESFTPACFTLDMDTLKKRSIDCP